eukprot:16429859-Heterocapsa_arctica.AAC.1
MVSRKQISYKEDINKQAKLAKNKELENKQVEDKIIAEDPIEAFIQYGESKGPPTILDMLRNRNHKTLGRV